MVDNKTVHLGLPLPDLSNEQTEDVPRIGQALAMLDARAQSVDAALELQSGEVQALKKSDTALGGRLESFARDLDQEATTRAAADREASGRLQILSETQTSLGHRVDSLDDTAAEQASRLEEVASTISNASFVFIGHVFPLLATDSYVPEGCVPANGGEYTRDQFPTLYDDYLAGGKLITCTYAAWAAQVAQTGNCAKFALDTVAQKFKVPLLKDGDSITQAASSAELGKSVKAGLPNIIGGMGRIIDSTTYPPTGALYSGSASESLFNISGPGTVQALKFDASRSNPTYGNSTTVTDEQVRLRHFVVVASAQNSASVFDWSAYMAALAGKANVDLSNVTGNAIGLYFHVRDEKPSGTVGGSTSSTTWHTRDLNTIKKNTIGASLASNKITLQAGTYYIYATVPAYSCSRIRAALYDCTSGAYLLHGPTAYAALQNDAWSMATLGGTITLTGTRELELRMYAQSANSWGMGLAASNAGVPETYSEVHIWKM